LKIGGGIGEAKSFPVRSFLFLLDLPVCGGKKIGNLKNKWPAIKIAGY